MTFFCFQAAGLGRAATACVAYYSAADFDAEAAAEKFALPCRTKVQIPTGAATGL